MEWFRNRIDAKIVIEQFRRQYNEVRPHSSLGQRSDFVREVFILHVRAPQGLRARKATPRS